MAPNPRGTVAVVSSLQRDRMADHEGAASETRLKTWLLNEPMILPGMSMGKALEHFVLKQRREEEEAKRLGRPLPRDLLHEKFWRKRRHPLALPAAVKRVEIE